MTKEELREYKRKWRNDRKDDPGYKEKRKAESKRYREKHKNRISAERRIKYQEDEEHRNKIKEKNKDRWRRVKDNTELRKEYNKSSREWYKRQSAEYKREVRQRQYQWLKENPEKLAAYIARKRRERKARYTKHLDKAIEMLGGKCQICGLVDHPIIYDFHHRDPQTKSFAISQYMGGIGWERLKAELVKCDLLCSHCHRKVTHGIS